MVGSVKTANLVTEHSVAKCFESCVSISNKSVGSSVRKQ